MKLKFVGMWVMMMAVLINTTAQEEFTDDELTKYATVMNWAKVEQSKMSTTISNEINNNEILSGANYKTLKAAEKAGEELSSTEVSEEEVAEFTRIQELTATIKAEFKATYTEKIKSDIGAGLYNRLKKALKSDAELKARYDEILAELTAENEDAEGTN